MRTIQMSTNTEKSKWTAVYLYDRIWYSLFLAKSIDYDVDKSLGNKTFWMKKASGERIEYTKPFCTLFKAKKN